MLKTNQHKTEQPQYMASISLELETPTNLTEEIIQYALKGLDIIYKEGYLFKKVGIMVLGLIPEEQPQDKVGIAWGLNKQTEKQKADALAMVKKLPVQIVNGDDRWIHPLARPKNSENKGTTGFTNAGKCDALIP